jgi:LacI family transcriptional regulator
MLDAAHAMGYRRIGFIGSVENLDGGIQQFGEKRSKAYKEWQEAHGTWEPELCILGDNCGIGQNLRLETGYKLASRILALKDRPDIFLTANDNMAIGAYRAIQEAGLSIPDDIAVMSFNDIPVAQFLTPALSTMKIFGEPIGETAFDLLAERVSGRDYTKTVTIPTRMIWRDSSRKPVI